jgi:glycosyltransferase involved in cell wall biosynthesis
LTVIEALAAGTPVVVTPSVGSGEDLDSAVCRVVEPGDIDALDAAVTELIAASPSIRDIARREAEKFSPAAIAPVLEAALLAVVV